MRMVLVAVGLSTLAADLFAQDRDTKVRNDRKTFEASPAWIYNDLEEARRVAAASRKPMLVVFRCIPCEACQEFDDDVARRDPIIRDLLDQFVCARFVQANAMDLTHFQFDFDQSFALFLMNADLTIYGRFATRSDREESRDLSLEGLRKAMAAALRIHQEYPARKSSLEGKQVRQARYRTPREYPSLAGKYQARLDYEGKVARSCIHCHQVREAERLVFRSGGQPIPDEVLFPYPDPEVLGLSMDPTAMARVERVAAGSIAARAGLESGDEIGTLAGQPLLSTADLQWVLHTSPSTAELNAEIRRAGKSRSASLVLSEGWRRGNLSWRASTWDLRRIALGGMRLDPLPVVDRGALRLPPEALALRVRHVGEFGAHAVARNAGVRKGDVIVGFDGRENPMTESDLIALAVQRRRPGDEVDVVLLRDGSRKTVRFALQ